MKHIIIIEKVTKFAAIIDFVIAFLVSMNIAVTIAYPDTQSICVVPQGKCTSEASPCTGLASADMLSYPVSHTDGDTAKISYQFWQGNIPDQVNSPEEIILDVCYEIGAQGGEIGMFNVILIPTGFITDPAPTCAFNSSQCLMQGYTDCATGWHELPMEIDSACLSDTTIENVYFDYNTYADHPGKGVILTRVKFAGVNKKSADLSTLSPPYYTPGVDYIASLVFYSSTEVNDENTLDITGTEIPTDIQ
ncbi:MAG: hypothetical protein AB1546_07155, partial [bacterium]